MKFFGIFSIVFFSCFGRVDLAAQASPCQSIDHQAFDFWIGEWEVRLPNGQLAGHNSIRKIHGNCVVEENWTGVGVSRGSSVNHFDPNTKKWKQKWLDNSGLNLEFIGEIKDDALTTFAETISPKTGDVVFNRMTIAKIDENNVSQIWEQSSNKESWQPVFEGHYKRMTHTVNSKLAFAVYDTFSIAYQELKPEIVANLYRPDAIYISGKQDATRGRAAILESFTSFFSSIKESNRTMLMDHKKKMQVSFQQLWYAML